MTTKRNWIDLVLDNISGGDAPAEIRGKFHPRVIAIYINMAFNDILIEVLKEANFHRDFSTLDPYVKRYVEKIKIDSITQKKYVDMPVSVVPMFDAEQYRLVCPPLNEALAFAYLANNSQAMWEILEAAEVDSTPGFSIEAKKMWFDDNLPVGQEDILMKLLVSFQDLNDDDEVVIPGGKNEILFERVYNFMSGKRTVARDDYNDGNSKQFS